ncbi:ABC transporter permease [Saccharopolyspora sp. CA-218241]|uniref:ABC transporter permease n=1 Tax=Saccharopolyspora sp. CA-218241 TaxID=3240027 RepID=UPI003D969B40
MTAARAGGIVLVLLCLVALAAPLLAPFAPDAPAGPSLAGPSASHLLGTDALGHDVVSRLLWGARWSLPAAGLAAGVATALGVSAGVVAGLATGVAGAIADRVVDIALAVPRLPLIVLVAVLAGPGRVTVPVLIGLLAWAPMARVLRGRVRVLRRAGYVDVGRGFGAGPLHLARRHLLPAVAPLLAAEAMLVASGAVLMEAGLAFLGLGDPTAVSWGLDLHRALGEPGVLLTGAWTWWVLPTGLAVAVTSVAFALLATGPAGADR